MQPIQSPLNYTGGKYKLLKQILPLFPERINTFVDLFCGGASVGVNVECNHVVFNDISTPIIRLLQTFQRLKPTTIFNKIQHIIQTYQLSDSSRFGYETYGCDSYKGLGPYNQKPFLQLRNDFNHASKSDSDYYLMLYVLIVYAFNNQIRFNSSGAFNLPVGKRDFNHKMQAKLKSFVERLKTIDCTFSNRNFIEMPINHLTDNDFIYLDPPYLITCATYNENNAWNEQQEYQLYEFADTLNRLHIRFALSNVLKSKGKENQILQQWLNNRNYTCHHLKFGYANSNYQTKDKQSQTDEVLITNY